MAHGGRTPAQRADDAPPAEVLELTESKGSKLVRRTFVHGLLNGYTLEPDDEAA